MSRRPHRPAAYIVDGDWPTGTLAGIAPRAAPVVAHAARIVADEVDRTSVTDLAERSGVSPTTIRDLVAGRRWPRLVTLAALDDAITTASIWPERRRPQSAAGGGPTCW